MFSGMIDGIWILFPVAIFGTIVNGFLVSEEINVANFSETITLIQYKIWILRTKAELSTQINTMITVDCVFKLLQSSVNFAFKAWILTISPMLGYSTLPTSTQCFIATVIHYLCGMGAIIFGLLANVLR